MKRTEVVHKVTETRKRESPPGIKDIAKALGISIGTVDRALHGRSGISPMTRAKVLTMAQTLGYQPNFAARHLKLNRKLSISVHLPKEIACVFDALREGIEEAAHPHQSTVELHFHSHSRLGEGETELFAQALAAGTNGIILAPGHPSELKSWIRKAARAHVPVVCVATDAPGTERLSSVATDAFTSGALVAEVFHLVAPRTGAVLIVAGDLSTVDHSEKVRGFRSFLETAGSALRVEAVLEAYDDVEQGYHRTRDYLAEHPEIQAVYVCTANSMPVIAAMEDVGRIGMPLVTTDLFPALAPLIRDGRILATIYQRPRAQGRMAFDALYQFLVRGTCPPVRHRVQPHLILRSNLDVFLEMLPTDSETSASAQVPRGDARSKLLWKSAI